MADKFTGEDKWDDYLKKLETITPEIRALGITDYLSIDRYEEILEHKAAGRIPRVGLIFPNVEMRFGIETNKGAGINLHLLFSPDDPKHVEEIRRFLRRLEFRNQKEVYVCCKEDLIRLGRIHDPQATSDIAAIAVGTNQFKVNFDQLREVWEQSEWAKQNCLIAVAGGETDGTSGLRDPSASFALLRKTIESFAHIVFSANPKQTEFWLGRGAASIDDLNTKWNGPKPCLHGSDAHDLESVGKPVQNRLCWIKGDLTFESLRQTCIEPEARVYLGSEPPRGALPAQIVTSIKVTACPWLSPSEIPLNPGLVAVIGSRGSGKTALADLLATGAHAASRTGNDKSFISRAREHLKDCQVEVSWENGEVTHGRFDTVGDADFTFPAVQYLSQQFVDELCSSDGLAEALVHEIERVVFHAHPEEARGGAANFEEMKEMRSSLSYEKRTRFEDELRAASEGLAQERVLKQQAEKAKVKHAELAKQIDQDVKDQRTLVGKGQEGRAKRHEEVAKALEVRMKAHDAVAARIRSLNGLNEDVTHIRSRQLPNIFSQLRANRSDAGLTEEEWNRFAMGFVGDVNKALRDGLKRANEELKQIAGAAPPAVDDPIDPNIALIPDGADLTAQTVELLQRERSRLAAMIGIDTQNSKRYKVLSEKLVASRKALDKLDKEIKHAATADVRIETWFQKRAEAYKGVFEAVVDLQNELLALYAPLEARLTGSSGSLGKLSFSVRRQVDIERWASSGEALLDLRRAGPFKGRGELLNTAKKMLLKHWETGTPEEVSAAMAQFIKEKEAAIREHKPDEANITSWASDVAAWLHGTDHIQISYGLRYNGVDVERLSQGTRGIVLLLLYLAIDEEDDRPLIIDQPEESLDPQSVFDELVGRFRTARSRRQVIIVTHNANLVVNTDADQVIVATAQPQPGRLPQITYACGGLENAQIRQRVCEILEGGEEAFKSRARRLRVRL